MNEFSTIQRFAQRALDTALVEESKTQILVNSNKFIDFDFNQAGAVRIMSLLFSGLSDYSRANERPFEDGRSQYPTGTGYKVGNLENKWQIYQLRYDRGTTFYVDSVSNEENVGKIVGGLVDQFGRVAVVPEVDEVRVSTMASVCKASYGNLVSGDIETNSVLKEITKAFTWLKENEVPSEDQVLFVSNDINEKIINTTELSRFITQGDYKVGEISFKVNKFMGRPIIEVPSSRFFTDVIVGQNGYRASSTSKIINFIVCSVRACVPIVKVEKLRIFDPSQVQDYDGYKINYRIFHDIIIPENKEIAFYTSVSTTSATTKVNKLFVDEVAGTSTNGYVVKGYRTNPAGKLGRLYVSKTALTVGGEKGSATLVELNKEIITTDTTAYFGLLDGYGKFVAVSDQITLVKKGA